jgi:hypothetical protein
VRVTASRARALGSVAGLAAVLAVAGCGHSTHGTPPASQPAKPSSDPAAQQRLHRALLSAAELPLGFEQQDSAEASAIGCAGIDRVYLAPGITARAAVSFDHTITHSYLNETISLQPGAAAASVAAFGRAATDCATFAGAQGVPYRVTALPGIRRYGEATAAVRITAAARESRPVELVAVQVGDRIVVVANTDSGQVDTGLTQTVVQRAVEKVSRLG